LIAAPQRSVRRAKAGFFRHHAGTIRAVQENVVTIEHACTRVVSKPWGSTNLSPWSDIQPDGVAIGELWFQRPDAGAPASALLLKLLFTNEPLSIQVHPDDAFAQSIGLVNGKTEAWYILSATPEAKVAIGLKRQLTAPQLRASIEDGSIADLIQWRPARKDDVIFVPAGTIHAIGPGLVLAEIQQRSDTTFRLFDHGRQREIHVDNAVAAANAGPAEAQSIPQRLTDARSVLVASPHFVLEHIDLPPNSNWELHAEQETWVLVIEGDAQIEQMNAFVGKAIFVQADRASLKAGSRGVKGLLAYLGPKPDPNLLQDLDRQNARFPVREFSRSPDGHRAKAGSSAHPTEVRS
jgi:mannose-6-phosphate isomerase